VVERTAHRSICLRTSATSTPVSELRAVPHLTVQGNVEFGLRRKGRANRSKSPSGARTSQPVGQRIGARSPEAKRVGDRVSVGDPADECSSPHWAGATSVAPITEGASLRPSSCARPSRPSIPNGAKGDPVTAIGESGWSPGADSSLRRRWIRSRRAMSDDVRTRDTGCRSVTPGASVSWNDERLLNVVANSRRPGTGRPLLRTSIERDFRKMQRRRPVRKFRSACGFFARQADLVRAPDGLLASIRSRPCARNPNSTCPARGQMRNSA